MTDTHDMRHAIDLYNEGNFALDTLLRHIRYGEIETRFVAGHDPQVAMRRWYLVAEDRDGDVVLGWITRFRDEPRWSAHASTGIVIGTDVGVGPFLNRTEAADAIVWFLRHWRR